MTQQGKKPVFTPEEKKSIFGLSAILFFRMMGLFLILPVFSLLASEGLEGATPILVGLAMGAYGLTSAILQIPFGAWSDRVGRKPVLAFGLLLFIAGSLMAAYAQTIEEMIAARLLQGAGAVSAPIFALIADLTRPEVRARANAVLGGGVGLAFGLSMFLAPFLASLFGLSGLFMVITGMACFALILLFIVVPTPLERVVTKEPMKVLLGRVLTIKPLRILNLGSFVASMGLTVTFYHTPFVLKAMGLDKGEWWKIYLPMLLAGAVVMVPAAILAEVKNKFREVMLGGIVLMLASAGLLGFSWGTDHLALQITAAFLFFMAYNVYEPLFPSLVTRLSTPETKGTASGVYNFTQFFGQFSGGVVAGLLYTLNQPVLPLVMALTALWFGLRLLRFPNPEPRIKADKEAAVESA